MSSFLLAGDVGVRVTGDAARRLVGGWLSEETLGDESRDVEVRATLQAIDAPARARDAFFGEIDVWAEGDAHVLVAPSARARVSGGVVDVHGEGAKPAWLGLLALALALRTRGVFHLHAGGVVLDAGPVLVVGGSGAGKTTTTLALLAEVPDARSLGDDTLFLRSDGAILATARPHHLTDATLAMFPALAARVTGTVHEAMRKHVVRVTSEPFTEPRPTRACLFPAVTDERTTSYDVLTRAETLALLIAQSAVLALPGVAAREEHLALLARLADATRGIALRLGADARVDPRRAAGVALEAIARCD